MSHSKLNDVKKSSKLPDGYAFYKSIGSPRFICAPMVQQSEVKQTISPFISFFEYLIIHLVTIPFFVSQIQHSIMLFTND